LAAQSQSQWPKLDGLREPTFRAGEDALRSGGFSPLMPAEFDGLKLAGSRAADELLRKDADTRASNDSTRKSV
jgi:hypothetical protein